MTDSYKLKDSDEKGLYSLMKIKVPHTALVMGAEDHAPSPFILCGKRQGFLNTTPSHTHFSSPHIKHYGLDALKLSFSCLSFIWCME